MEKTFLLLDIDINYNINHSVLLTNASKQENVVDI